MKQAPRNPDSATPPDLSPRRQVGTTASGIAELPPEPRAELAATQARYFDLYDQAPVGYITLGESGLILEANLTAASLLGVARDALFGQPISCFVCEEYQDSYGSHCKQLFETGTPQKCELRMLRTDGTPFWAHHTAQVARNARGLPVCRVVLSDISSRKLAEESLRMKHRVFESSITANSIASPNGVLTEVNAAFLRCWGYPNKEECLGKPIVKFFNDPDEAAATMAVLNSSDHWEGEFTARRKDGSTFMAYALATIVRGDHGEVIGFQSAVMDISGRKQDEQSLRHSEGRYRDLFELAVDGILQGSNDGRITGANAQMQKLAGRSLEQLLGLHVSELFDPGELNTKPLRFDLLNDMRLLVNERNLVRPDGTSLPVEMHSKRMPDGTYQSIFRDITERRRTEQALRESEARLNTTQRLSKIGGWEWDIEQQSMFWTEETYRIHEYTKGEVGTELQEHIAKSLGCCDEADRPWILASFQQCVEHGIPYDIEYAFTTATGRRLWARTSAYAVRDGSRIVKVVGSLMDITERKQAQEELREFNELLALFMRNSPIYSYIKTVTASESRVLHASDNFYQMIGVPGAQMAGKTMAELFPAELAAKITSDDWNVVSSGKMVRFEEDFKDRSYESIKFPIVQGKRTLLAGYTIDITEHKQAEQTLREWNQILERRVAERTSELLESEARLRQMADASFEGIAISEDGILLDCNAQLGLMHGYEPAEMIGRPVTDFVAPESRTAVNRSIQDGYETTYEFFALRQDGSSFPMEAHACMRTWQGRITRVTALRDLSASKRAAASLLEQQIELEQAQRLAMVSEISAGIIHQIGQPLCAMGANLMVAMARLGACEMKSCGSLEIINDVASDVARMRQAVTHLRALAHPEQPTRVPIDLNALVADVLRLLRQEAGNRQLRVAFETGQPLPLVLADAVQLSQVILNLVRNAFDSCATCPPERRTLVITTREVTGEGVELSVCDAGIGIGPETMSRLFSPFFSTKPEGLGIGLRLSRTIVEAHGGHIVGRNNPDGIGATFRVMLPAIP